VLGTLFPSQLWADRAPPGEQLFASFFGGLCDPQALSLSDDELERLVAEEHERLLGIPCDRVRLLAVMRHAAAIPQLLPGHAESMAALRAESARHPGLFLAGGYLSGVAIEHATSSGEEAAEAYLSRAGARP
jgi:oxygen-dependent protoporphyrinogen oxidase